MRRGAVNVTNPEALTDPGPQDPGLAGQERSFLNPPATDVNGMPQFWASFNLASPCFPHTRRSLI
jgi:oxalate decarboxylase